MKFENLDGPVGRVSTIEESFASHDDYMDALNTLLSVPKEAVESFIFMVKIKPGTIDNDAVSDCISVQAGNMQDIAAMLAIAHNGASCELAQEEIRALSEDSKRGSGHGHD